MSGRLCARILAAVTLLSVLNSYAIGDEALEHPVNVNHSRPITKPGLDPQARSIALFDGIEEGSFRTRVIAKSPYHGSVLITNATDEVLTVEFPETFVAVQVLKQFQPGGNGLGNLFGNAGGPGGNAGQPGQGNGQQQSIGGGAQQPGGANNFAGPGGPPGNGFFSIPPEKTVAVKFQSVCLEHGKANPTPKSTYQLVKTEIYTDDDVLQEVIRMAACSEAPQRAIQAAVWHQANQMSWQQLADKYVCQFGRRIPYFKTAELNEARQVIAIAQNAAANQRQSHPPSRSVAARTR